ncbi:MAG: ATP-dependent RNA helicase DbpA [Thiotrichaceae bacterium]|nr:ATP-dependent RNA helicase DbpA [Thiotrichaceae bacterium]PCI11168.1 MAG: ATP-dependent RNA helicase DbpA [Thiotrichales bacterium]
MNDTAFASLALQPTLIKNLSSLEYLEMTPIQAQSLPHILAGKDVIGQGKTGSGKTAAFSLGLLEKLNTKHFQVQALVLCPTRELADQVAKEIRRLARAIQNIKVLTLCGGVPFKAQTGSMARGAHIIVGTPGRVEEHVRRGTLKLDGLNTLVLDEADRMLDMGFQPSLDVIIDGAPKQRQTLLFSATYPNEIKSIAKRIMNKPVVVQVDATHDNESIRQHLFKVDAGGGARFKALRLLLQQYRPGSTLVFCNTKKETLEVAESLDALGFSALALNGDLEQKDRDRILVRFSNKSVSILVATDVAARGLDIDALDAVINYNVANDLEVHIHRVGRTGRAGSSGIACTLFSENEQYKIERLEAYLKHSIDVEALPSLNLLDKPTYKPPMATLQIGGGKKQKVRAGDILGALTGEDGIDGKQVGKIQIFDQWSYVAVSRNVANHALNKLSAGKVKGRSFRVFLM